MKMKKKQFKLKMVGHYILILFVKIIITTVSIKQVCQTSELIFYGVDLHITLYHSRGLDMAL